PHFIFFLSLTTPAATDIYSLSLHDALPIYVQPSLFSPDGSKFAYTICTPTGNMSYPALRDLRIFDFDRCSGQFSNPYVINLNDRSEEHTSELQSRENLVCRLLLEKKKNKNK